MTYLTERGEGRAGQKVFTVVAMILGACFYATVFGSVAFLVKVSCTHTPSSSLCEYTLDMHIPWRSSR